MRAVGLKVLKNKLSDYVRLAASGETVLVTDRDRVVAESQAGRSPLLAETVRSGWVAPPALADRTPPLRVSPSRPFASSRANCSVTATTGDLRR
jgi:antitoxin (DNA-binding transcriptional repressor) of toxin-antitoxin stability system